MGIFSSKCISNARLDGKTAVVTGCNVGIGKETARDFYKRGAKVIMACRNIKAANEAAEDIKKSTGTDEHTGQSHVIHLDSSNLTSVRECCEKLVKNEDSIDLLVNNAGVMMCPYSKTADGFEQHFGTNHLGHFSFTSLLLPKIIQSRPSRIVMVSSLSHWGGVIDFEDLNWTSRSYSGMGAYRQSKLANVLFAKELAVRLKENNLDDVSTYSSHPGVVATDLSRHFDGYVPGLKNVYNFFTRFFAKDAQQGAQTTIYCAVHENCSNQSGSYYDECRVMKASAYAADSASRRRSWDVSWELVGSDKTYDPFRL